MLFSDENDTSTQRAPPLGDIPSLVADGLEARIKNAGDVAENLTCEHGLSRLITTPHLICHSAFTLNRLARIANASQNRFQSARSQRHLDLAELYAFCYPARFAAPTPQGIIKASALDDTFETGDLHGIAQGLLKILAAQKPLVKRQLCRIARTMELSGWAWGPYVGEVLKAQDPEPEQQKARGLEVWVQLKEWQDDGPAKVAKALAVSAEEAEAQLEYLAASRGGVRQGQSKYTAAAALAFQPKDTANAPNVVLAEAGTGIGKTLGYLAPASLWARQNGAPVWLSTYTKNLQRQLVNEIKYVYPDPVERREKTAVRKGRENYLCLLNYQDMVTNLQPHNERATTLAGLAARWIMATRDGDMVSGDFLSWLMPLFTGGRGPDASANTHAGFGLTDRRGECVYSACPHYRKCFIEKSVRKSRKADLVVANHALVMVQAALDQSSDLFKRRDETKEEPEEESPATAGRHFVFDEGHHVFDAADSAFSAHLTALETAELRRWLRGNEGQRRQRSRGLKERFADLFEGDDETDALLNDALEAAKALPAGGWRQRISSGVGQNTTEYFMVLVHSQVAARTKNRHGRSMEADCDPPIDGLADAANQLRLQLEILKKSLSLLSQRLEASLDDEASEHDSVSRIRIEAAIRGLKRRANLVLPSWLSMLGSLAQVTPEEFVDWFSIETAWGNLFDVGMHRHWVDPSLPFARTVLEPSQGVLITSATLRDKLPDAPDDWRNADVRSGAYHLATPPHRFEQASPFDYANKSRILIVNDVNRDEPAQVAAALRELFLAAGGGGLGLFTAISRLEKTFAHLSPKLTAAGHNLYAQHIDPMDTGTLVDLFRVDINSCLLGTDAVRDGIDVPGESLRLIVFDRVPWPQPTILNRARRDAFGGNGYQDMMARLKLQQAFGRLIRNESDRGIFIMLDSRLPTRLTTAFPPQAPLERLGLVDAIDKTMGFFTEKTC
jgi:ATP-dependent DNA helicase DinG